MYFCWVTLPVRDLQKSLNFYHQILGLPIASKYETEAIEMVMLGEEDKPKIELIRTFGKEPVHTSSDITVGIAVESMASAYKLLKENNISVLRGPIAPNPNLQFIFINDPDGYEVQLVEMK